VKQLTPREITLRTLRRQHVDRMPVTLDVGASHGIDSSYIDEFRFRTNRLDPAEYFDYDIRLVRAPLSPTCGDFTGYYDSVPPGTTFDEFGVGHVPSTDFPLGRDLHPWQLFDTPEQVRDYPFPVFELQESTREAIRGLHERGYAVSVASGSINEWCCYLRGMDEFMMDLAFRPEMAAAILDKVTSLCARMGGALAGAGADILCFYGDMGGQKGLLIGPEMWGKWILGRWREIISAARRRSADALLFYHSCGFIEPIIPGLIDAGFQILNPVQPESMDPVRIKRLFGDRISLWGGIGVQSTMLGGSPDDVRTAAAELIRKWTRGGGGIVTAAQTILRDVPWENVLALVEAIGGRPTG
jgi:uroporphyrinogen decarboxylase